MDNIKKEIGVIMNNVEQAQKELSFIKEIIENSREKLYDSGVHLVLWGVLVSIGQFSNYVTISMRKTEYLGYIWLVIVLLGWGGGFIIDKREKLVLNPNNFANKISSTLWIGGGVSMTIIGFSRLISFGEFYVITPMAINPIISIILGSLYFATGAIYDIKWFSRLAYGWWGIAIVLFSWVSYMSFLVYGFVLIGLMVVPGIILNRNYKRILKERALEEE
ncbi:MAG: hypothetical protein CR982_06225 [Candidatus Cloacimonadota bacterium]|nr:MAG: hypothetical protein CR982_06225 [Candidatus Cloacimonadota bacterium]PIE78117.1 MAG: hypothetical protein CSA15_09785 [Candidatus Delongbacteria bacterium]